MSTDTAPETARYARMYDSNLWRARRLGILAKGPTCKCGAPAVEVIHTHKHRGCWQAFLDGNNIAAVCRDHAP